MIENLIAQDQALTSQVLKLADSSFYRGLSEVVLAKLEIHLEDAGMLAE